MYRFGSLVALVAVSALAGCAAEATDDVADVGGDMAETSDTEALTQAGKALIGEYTDDTGAFRRLVLTAEKVGQANKFIADVDTGIRCITTPCPSSLTIEGTFTAGTKTITFKVPGKPNAASHLLGKYNYIVQGEKFSLFRKGFAQSLAKTPAPGFCANGTRVTEVSFVPSLDGKECVVPEIHCVTKQAFACPMLSPMHPDFCKDGTLEFGSSFIDSSDGLECRMPNVHCLTKDLGACPMLSPMHPDFCKDGEIRTEPNYIASADGKECSMPRIHCISKAPNACPQL
jgi:hypothetical protein